MISINIVILTCCNPSLLREGKQVALALEENQLLGITLQLPTALQPSLHRYNLPQASDGFGNRQAAAEAGIL